MPDYVYKHKYNITRSIMKFIAKTIITIQSGAYYGADEVIEIAKGKYELVTSARIFFKKLKRIIRRKR